MEAHGGAELLGEVACLGAAQEDVERASETGALACGEMVDHGFLRGRHFGVGEGLETVAYEAQVVFGGLGEEEAGDQEEYEWAHDR